MLKIDIKQKQFTLSLKKGKNFAENSIYTIYRSLHVMQTKLTTMLNAIDEINAQDPNKIVIAGQLQPKELIYGQQMTACLNQYWLNSDEILQIAVRAQHIKRWHIKRNEFALGKAGYYQWRIALGKYHAQLTSSLMLNNGYSETEAQATATIIRKENIKTNHNSQTLEDVACLVFLQHYFNDFAKKHHDEKVIRILQKTWGKMSAKGQKIALELTLSDHLSTLLTKALT